MNRWLTFLQMAGLSTVLGGCLAAFPFDPAPEPPEIIAKSGGSYLGIGVQEVNGERAKALGLKEERGVEITRVQDDSPASRAGLKTGDVLLEYNGQRLEGVEQFMRMVRETPPGREARLTASRSGSLQQVSVVTGQRSAWIKGPDLSALEAFRFEMPQFPDVPRAHMSWRSSAVGLEAETLDSQLAEYFGVKEGVLVRSVVKGSAADKAGIKAGDVLVKVDETKVTTPRDVSSALRAARSSRSVPVQIVREKRELTMHVAADDPQAEKRD